MAFAAKKLVFNHPVPVARLRSASERDGNDHQTRLTLITHAAILVELPWRVNNELVTALVALVALAVLAVLAVVLVVV
jgi:hypothetical protein